MTSTYTTLGAGQATKVLHITEHRPARTITTCPAPAATALAHALHRTDRQIASALYPLAVERDGRPVQARRHLLNVFDAATGPDASSAVTATGVWETPEALVRAVASAVAGLPAPVVAAVRRELSAHLDGFDGVLVPARVTSSAYRSGVLDVVISGPLHSFYTSWWDNMNAATTMDDDRAYPVGAPIVDAPSELYDVIAELYEAEPADNKFASSTMRELQRAGDDSDEPYVIVAAKHLVAFAAAHRRGSDQLPGLQ